ncbi:sigma 54-interacting transcriptional regulator [Natroniella sulfidigena]|uniref:sigma 54-interacting transcriptional regulator n=1 Tax=Natroniella sulfidigena TaxID=723921 RepID=UPI00200B5845|nr:sigma 54-interacting transcriptional regulator [Natroniella sulfidigena]MCK8818038.1 sigma 54-interacting transcriptional regulator [Natroniella sulfidigena]
MKDKIYFIAPYQKLKRIADQVIAKNDLAVSTVMGDMQGGVEQAKRLVEQGAEVLISRGGTASLIKDEVDIPVVEIMVTGYDLLKVLYKYRTKQTEVGIIGYESIISGTRTIAEILDIYIDYYTLVKEQQVEERIQEAMNNGIKTIIGDTVGVKAAKKYGLKYELIKSGREAILNSIQEAEKIYEATLLEREKKEKLDTILDSAHEGIVAVDDKGIITAFNPRAQRLFNKRKGQALGKKVEEIIPNTKLDEVIKTGEEQLGSIQNVGEVKIATNRVPIKVGEEIKGAVASFQDVTKIQKLEQKIRQQLNKKGLTAKYTLADIIGNSRKIKQIKNLAKEYGAVNSTVLLKGESGTGKELFAQGIHNCSQREGGPFVAINCSALPTNLLESELFGYEEGTFTGAKKGGKKGLFELAHNGTIFLDEIGEMDKALQARLLRVIQERRIMRLGARKVIPIDVRIIAATNRDLQAEIKQSNFRKDLYYRLNVLDLTIPPLRDRKEDIELIAEFLLNKKSRELNKSIREIDDQLMELLIDYSWPGNVRELENIIEKMIVIAKSEVIKKDDVDFIVERLDQEQEFNETGTLINLDAPLEVIEQEIIKKVVEREETKTAAAERLGITRSTLWRKLNN